MKVQEVVSEIKKNIPESSNNPQLMNSFMALLSELDKVVMRMNETPSVNKVVIEIKIEEKQ